MTTKQAQQLVSLRIVVRDPVPNIDLRLQSVRSDLLAPASASAAAVVFDFAVRVALPDGARGNLCDRLFLVRHVR